VEEMEINGLSLDEWLGGHETLKMKIRLPLKATRTVRGCKY